MEKLSTLGLLVEWWTVMVSIHISYVPTYVCMYACMYTVLYIICLWMPYSRVNKRIVIALACYLRLKVVIASCEDTYV